jgi:replicative DNA helicase
MEFRIPPHSLDAEASVLGSVLLDSYAHDALEGSLTPESFYKEAHRKIWGAMTTLRARREPIDLVTLSDVLRQQGELENVGGFSYLAGLSDATPTAAFAEHYGRIVAEKYALRQIIQVSGEAMRQAYGESETPGEILEASTARMIAMSLGTSRDRAKTATDVAKELDDHVKVILQTGGRSIGLPTGLDSLDDLLGGLKPGSLYYIAARPSMGKSGLMLNMAQHLLLAGYAVGIFSLEMPARDLFMRMVCRRARIDIQRLQNGKLYGPDLERYKSALQEMSQTLCFIDETADVSISELKARARRMVAQRVSAIFVDYLQLMGGADDSGANRQQEITVISRGLKNIARELNVPVIALSQLSRAVEQRPNKRPMLSDLRDSGSLEQDCDVGLFIYRDEYYNPHTIKAGIAEIIVGKNRNGPTGVAEATFVHRFAAFEGIYDKN